jgi:hypothetical protein
VLLKHCSTDQSKSRKLRKSPLCTSLSSPPRPAVRGPPTTPSSRAPPPLFWWSLTEFTFLPVDLTTDRGFISRLSIDSVPCPCVPTSATTRCSCRSKLIRGKIKGLGKCETADRCQHLACFNIRNSTAPNESNRIESKTIEFEPVEFK